MPQSKLNPPASILWACQRSFVSTFGVLLLIYSLASLPKFYCAPFGSSYFNSATAGVLLFLTSATALLVGFLGSAVTFRRGVLELAVRAFVGDALAQSKMERLDETCSQLTFWGLVVCYVALITKTAFYPDGVGDWLAGWLQAAARDATGGANIAYPYAVDYQHWIRGILSLSEIGRAPDLCLLSKSIVAVLAIVLPLRQVFHGAALLTSFVGRAAAHSTGVANALLDSMRASQLVVQITDKRPRLMNAIRSLSWLCFCYLALFWLFGFCPGQLGFMINNFLAFSVREANFAYFDMHLMRPFLASVIALYATVPTAVMTSVFLPPRKPNQFTITDGAILFSESYLLALNFRLLRSFSDIESVTMVASEKDRRNSSLTITFRSAGRFECLLRQVEEPLLNQFLSILDEQAENCFFDREVRALKRELAQELNSNKYGAAPVCETAGDGAANFKSTNFNMHDVGETLKSGRLRVVKQLASQSCAASYLIRNGDGQLCVLNQYVVPSSCEKSVRLKESLRRECESLRQLDCPSVAKILDTFEDDSSYYIVMERMNGETLEQLVTCRGAQSESTVIYWAEQIARTMSYVHSRNGSLVHKDLNPQSFIVDRSGAIRLIDFGTFSRFPEAVSGMLVRKNSQLAYMAPELLRGKFTAKSDIYSFGSILSYLLTGAPPVALQSTDLAEEVLMLSPWLIELIRNCTALDDSSRIGSFDEILQTLKSSPSRPLSPEQRQSLSGESSSGRKEQDDLIALYSEEYMFLEKLKSSAQRTGGCLLTLPAKVADGDLLTVKTRESVESERLQS